MDNFLKSRTIAAQMPLIIFLIFSTLAFSGCGNQEPTDKVIKVAVAPVVKKDIPIYSEIIGETIGSVDLAIRVRVDGQLESIHFEEGRPVDKDQLLYTIDPKPLEAGVLAAEGEVREAETGLEKSVADLARVKPLAAINAVSQRDLDAAVAAHKGATARLSTSQAKLDYAKIQLGYSKIYAPVSGIIGITKAKVGDYVGKEPNPVVLNVISQIDPIHVKVVLSENEYLVFAKRKIESQGNLDSNSQQRSQPELELILTDGTIHEEKGTIIAVDNQIDPMTGTLTLKASFPNPQKLIKPGQFARIRFISKRKNNALLVWQRAVQELQNTFQLYVVDSNGLVTSRQVKPAEKIQGAWIIDQGVQEGELVIVEGIQRIRAGMTVEGVSPAELNIAPPAGVLSGENGKSE